MEFNLTGKSFVDGSTGRTITVKRVVEHYRQEHTYCEVDYVDSRGVAHKGEFMHSLVVSFLYSRRVEGHPQDG